MRRIFLLILDSRILVVNLDIDIINLLQTKTSLLITIKYIYKSFDLYI